MVDENEDILVQKQEEQRQFPQHFARRLHQVGKRTKTISTTFCPEASSGRESPFSLPDEASGRNVVEIVFVLPVFVLKYRNGESFQREKKFLRICVAHSMKCCKLHNVDGQFCSWKIASDYTCTCGHCLAWFSLQILYYSYGFWKIEKLRPKILFPKMW